jgi:hypothetical protein
MGALEGERGGGGKNVMHGKNQETVRKLELARKQQVGCYMYDTSLERNE